MGAASKVARALISRSSSKVGGEMPIGKGALSRLGTGAKGKAERKAAGLLKGNETRARKKKATAKLKEDTARSVKTKARLQAKRKPKSPSSGGLKEMAEKARASRNSAAKLARRKEYKSTDADESVATKQKTRKRNRKNRKSEVKQDGTRSRGISKRAILKKAAKANRDRQYRKRYK